MFVLAGLVLGRAAGATLRARWFALRGGVALLIAFGKHTPVHEIWRTVVRVFARMRYRVVVLS